MRSERKKGRIAPDTHTTGAAEDRDEQANTQRITELDDGTDNFYDELPNGAGIPDHAFQDQFDYEEELDFFGQIDEAGNDLPPVVCTTANQGRASAQVAKLTDCEVIDKLVEWHPDRKWEFTDDEAGNASKLWFAKPPAENTCVKTPGTTYSESDAIWWWIQNITFSPRHDLQTHLQ